MAFLELDGNLGKDLSKPVREIYNVIGLYLCSRLALETLSKKHNKAILHAKGVNSCLMYLDFFSITAQRNALLITSNCCQSLLNEEFVHVKESLGILSSR